MCNQRSRCFSIISSIYSKLIFLITLTIFIYGCSKNKHDSVETSVKASFPLAEKNDISNQLKTKNYESSNNTNKVPVLIKAQESQLEIQPNLVGNTLRLGKSYIENWPLGLPGCQNCNISVERKFYPDGPDTLLKLRNDELRYQWGLFQTSQKTFTLLDAKFYFNNKNRLIMDFGNERYLLKAGKIYTIKKCTINPLWIETIPPLSSIYSDDQAKHKIQILFECR